MPLTKVQSQLLSTGTVLQVVQGTYSTQGSTTSATAVATGLTASITPTNATSKILVLVSIGVQGAPTQNTAAYLYKNGSSLIFMGYPATGSAAGNSIANASYLDSPATTSSTTYAVYIGVTGGATAYWAVSNSTATITLIEIAG